MSNQAPSAPTLGETSLLGPLQITFFWQSPVDSGSAPIDKYELKIVPDEGASSTFIIDAPTNSYTVMSLKENVSVKAYVKASNDGGVSYGPEFEFQPVKPLVAPSQGPSSASAKVKSAGIATVSWVAPQIDLKSKAYYSITSQSSKETDPVIGCAVLDLTKSSCELTGLNTTSTYTFNIKVVNNAGESPSVITNSIKF
jgi:hypothetical protein